MRTILTICILAIAATAFSQRRTTMSAETGRKGKNEKIIFPDTIGDSLAKRLVESVGMGNVLLKNNFLSVPTKLTDTVIDNRSPIDNMPNAITKPSPLNYVDNNGQGFDIYRSGVDNMPVLMPDSANRASLGNFSVRR
jgi:hypothetical protein